MFGISGMVTRLTGGQRIAEMAERVAGRSRMGVWQRVHGRLPALGPTEARGYLRARAIAVVREETDRLIEQEGLSLGGYRSEIEETALHLLVTMISSQLCHPRAQTPRRRAA